jgi:regulator of replication initiation timing
LIGYKRGGKYQNIIDDAYRLGQIREAVIWPKVPAEGEKYRPTLTPEQQTLKDRLIRGELPPHSVSYDHLISMFDYYGHRTQVIYSVLAHRAGAPVFSAKTYRRSNDESSRAAAVNWYETAFYTDSSSSRDNLTGIDQDVAVYHHRGIYNNLDGLRHKRAAEALFVVGNGRSLRDFPLESLRDKAWLGMNAAYRYWSQVGIYPTYYSCFDEVVLDSHSDEIVDMVANREKLGISRFFLRESILTDYPRLRNDPSVYFLEDLQHDTNWFPLDRITTGSFSVLMAWFLGYREIYLLGIDLNYVERVSGSVEDGQALTLTIDPDTNPNYFFDQYQLKGDRFNPPNRHPGMHLRSWARIRSIIGGFPILIKNLNPKSALREFEFEDYRTTLRRIESRYSLPELTAERVVQVSREKRYWRELLLEQLARRPVRGTTELPDEVQPSDAQPSRRLTDREVVTAIVSRRRNILRRLVRWYASPSGLLFGTALGLGVGAVVAAAWSTWLALAALLLVGLFVPYRFSREQLRTDRRLNTAIKAFERSTSDIASLREDVASLKADLTKSLEEISRRATIEGEEFRRNLAQTQLQLDRAVNEAEAEHASTKAAIEDSAAELADLIHRLAEIDNRLSPAPNHKNGPRWELRTSDAMARLRGEIEGDGIGTDAPGPHD